MLIAAALVLFAQVPVRGGYALHDLPVMVLMGAGSGLAFWIAAGLVAVGIAVAGTLLRPAD